MEPPLAEWMLWATTMKKRHVDLQSRVDELEHKLLECLKSEPRFPIREQAEQHRNATTAIVRQNQNPHRRPSELSTVAETAFLNQEIEGQTICQGSKSLADYLERAREVQAEIEKRRVQIFLEGMNSRHQRVALESTLSNKQLWTWQGLQIEVQMMITDAERRRRNRRSLI